MSKTIADYLPANARAGIYSALGLLVALEAVWDFMPDVIEGKLLKTLTVLGFGLAVSQTPVRKVADDGE